MIYWSLTIADTAHTERYLGLASPDDNEAGYDVCNLTISYQTDLPLRVSFSLHLII